MKRRGELIIEASIMITILVSIVFLIISYALLIRTEIVIQSHFNQSAKQLSQYSNIVSDLIYDKNPEDIKKVDDLVEKSGKVIESISNPYSEGHGSESVNAMDLAGSILNVQDLIRDYQKSPKKILILMKNFASREAVPKVAPVLAEVLFRQALEDNKINLKDIGVIGDIKFLDAEYDSENYLLTLKIEYESKGMFYDMFKVNKNKVVLKTTVRLWVGAKA